MVDQDQAEPFQGLGHFFEAAFVGNQSQANSAQVLIDCLVLGHLIVLFPAYGGEVEVKLPVTHLLQTSNNSRNSRQGSTGHNEDMRSYSILHYVLPISFACLHQKDTGP